MRCMPINRLPESARPFFHYPSTVDEQSVHLETDYPDVKRNRNSGLPLVKWFLATPHGIVLLILAMLAIVLAAVAWFAILLTGRYPRGLFDFVMAGFNVRITGHAGSRHPIPWRGDERQPIF